MKTWIALAILLMFFVGLCYADAYQDAYQNKNIASKAYEHGKSVGRSLGACAIMKEIVKHSQDEAWKTSDQVKKSLEDCTFFEKLHAPGTTEVIKL